MSKQKSDFKNGTKQNKPYYIQDISENDNMCKVDEQIINKVKNTYIEKVRIEKFKINREDNKVLLSFDGEEKSHILYPQHMMALTLSCIRITKTLIPDCNFESVINQD